MAEQGLVTKAKDSRLSVLGIAAPDALERIGPNGANFSGTDIRVIVEGPVSALVSPDIDPAAKSGWWPFRREARDPLPVYSALGSILSFLPAQPGTVLPDEEYLCRFLRARGSELVGLLGGNAGFVECEVRSGFDAGRAASILAEEGPLAGKTAESPAEAELIARTNRQSIAGRRAEFEARLRRRLLSVAEDALLIEGGPGAECRRRILIERSLRGRIRAELQELARDIGAGAMIGIGPILPPVTFRRIDVKGADESEILAARAAFGLGDIAGRIAIRNAYHRTIERLYPLSDNREAKARRLAELGRQFELLNLVADGQIKAARGEPDMPIRLDAEAVSGVPLLRFEARDRALRAA